jgi:hypothetical protein
VAGRGPKLGAKVDFEQWVRNRKLLVVRLCAACRRIGLT